MRKFILFVFCSLMLSSCMTTRTSVGNYQESRKAGAKTFTYARGKQCYLFWGLVPLGRTNVATPPHGNCQIRTCYNFWDALVSALTAGIFEMQTITVKSVITNALSTSQQGNININVSTSNNNNLQNSNNAAPLPNNGVQQNANQPVQNQ